MHKNKNMFLKNNNNDKLNQKTHFFKSVVLDGVWLKSSFFLLAGISIFSLFNEVIFHFPEGEIKIESLSNMVSCISSYLSFPEI